MKAIAVLLVLLLLTAPALADITANADASSSGQDAVAIAAVSGSEGTASALAYASGIDATATSSGSAEGTCIWWASSSSSGSSSGYAQDSFTISIPEFTTNGEVFSAISLLITDSGCVQYREPSFTGLWIFGISDVERYWHFKAQEKVNCGDPDNSTCMRARYLQSVILNDHAAHNAIEFETKFPLEVVFQFNPTLKLRS